MVHAFTCLDHYFVMDVESGGVYKVDEIAYEVIRRFEQKSEAEILAALSDRFDPKDLEAAFEEILELKEEGILFSKADPRVAALSGQALNPGGVVKSLCLNVAHDCNLRCTYCFADTGEFMGKRELMSEETGRKALEFLMEHSAGRKHLEVDFFGGEPLMNFDVVKKLVAYGRELEKKYGKVIRFTITTNCLLLNDEVIDFLNREMHNIVLSLDGRPEVHDRLRKTVSGGPSSALVLENAKKLAKARGDAQYYIRGTFTRHNLDFAKDVAFLREQGFEQLSLEPVVTKDEALEIREADLPVIMAEYDKLARSYYAARRKPETWYNFFHFMVDLSQGPCLMKRLSGCGAGSEYMAVAPSGDIYPCHQFVGDSDFVIGSVHDGSVNREMQKRFAQNHVINKPECSECWARYYCSGGCPANAWQFHKDLKQPYKLGCEMEKKRLECAIAIYALEHDKEA
jgi:uncharacterized protein